MMFYKSNQPLTHDFSLPSLYGSKDTSNHGCIVSIVMIAAAMQPRMVRVMRIRKITRHILEVSFLLRGKEGVCLRMSKCLFSVDSFPALFVASEIIERAW